MTIETQLQELETALRQADKLADARDASLARYAAAKSRNEPAGLRLAVEEFHAADDAWTAAVKRARETDERLANARDAQRVAHL